MSELAVAVASVPGRSFNPAAGETKVSTANWYIANNWPSTLIEYGLVAIKIVNSDACPIAGSDDD